MPNARVKFRSAFFGALTAGFLWETTNLLFASFAGLTTRYTAIYSSFAIVLVFMIWLYLSWLILLIGASIAYHHQHPQQLRRPQDILPLGADMHERLALQAMVNIARASDGPSGTNPTLEDLARTQQVPAEALERVLGVLEADGLVCRTNDLPACFLPARPVDRIHLNEILRGSRETQDGLDEPVEKLFQEIDHSYYSALGKRTLAEFLRQYDNENQGHQREDSLI